MVLVSNMFWCSHLPEFNPNWTIYMNMFFPTVGWPISLHLAGYFSSQHQVCDPAWRGGEALGPPSTFQAFSRSPREHASHPKSKKCRGRTCHQRPYLSSKVEHFLINEWPMINDDQCCYMLLHFWSNVFVNYVWYFAHRTRLCPLPCHYILYYGSLICCRYCLKIWYLVSEIGILRPQNRFTLLY